MLDVPTPCTFRFPDGIESCAAGRGAHIHEPLPCANGKDERHHAFAPPKTVSVRIDGHVRRVAAEAGRQAAFAIRDKVPA